MPNDDERTERRYEPNEDGRFVDPADETEDDGVVTLPEFGLFAVDRETRVLRGLLLPYGERSRLSISKTEPVRFNPGDAKVPRDPSVVGLNRMHDRFDPLGRAFELDASDPRGVVAAFRVADTPEGDKYLANPGNLRRLSPEVRNMHRRPDGTATAEIVGAALVDEGAFETAALFAIDRPDDDDDTDDDTSDDATPESAPADDETPESAPADEDNPEAATADEDMRKGSETVTDAQVPNTVGGSGITEPRPMNKGELFAALASVVARTATPETIARLQENYGGVQGETGLFALNDVKYDGTGGLALGASGANAMTRPAWLGEVLDGTEYVQRFASLFGPALPLTAITFGGWRWNVKPAGGAWSGNKAAIPSNAPSVSLVSETAARWAGGHDHAREHVDFGTPGYFESYFAAMVEDYLRWQDETVVLTELLAASTELEADNPAGLEIGADMSALIDGAVAVLDAGLLPTFAVLPSAGWKRVLKTPQSDVLGYLNAQLGLSEGTLDNAGFIIRGSSEVTNPIVGSRNAADLYELPGSPIRAEALNIANGGVDTGLFGYSGLFVRNPAAIVEVTPYVA